MDEVNSFAVPLVKEMGGLFGLECLTAERISCLLSISITFFSLPLNFNLGFSVVQHKDRWSK